MSEYGDTDEATRQINKDLTLQLLILREANTKHREDLEVIEPIIAQAKANGMKTCSTDLLENSLDVARSMNSGIDILLDMIDLMKHTTSLREFQSVMNRTFER